MHPLSVFSFFSFHLPALLFPLLLSSSSSSSFSLFLFLFVVIFFPTVPPLQSIPFFLLFFFPLYLSSPSISFILSLFPSSLTSMHHSPCYFFLFVSGLVLLVSLFVCLSSVSVTRQTLSRFQRCQLRSAGVLTSVSMAV